MSGRKTRFKSVADVCLGSGAVRSGHHRHLANVRFTPESGQTEEARLDRFVPQADSCTAAKPRGSRRQAAGLAWMSLETFLKCAIASRAPVVLVNKSSSSS